MSKGYLFCQLKMLYERVRGWTSGRSLAVKKTLLTTPRVFSGNFSFATRACDALFMRMQT